jgi:hypothetical protein
MALWAPLSFLLGELHVLIGQSITLGAPHQVWVDMKFKFGSFAYPLDNSRDYVGRQQAAGSISST